MHVCGSWILNCKFTKMFFKINEGSIEIDFQLATYKYFYFLQKRLR